MIDHDEAAKLARIVLHLRQRRVDHLPAGLFGESAWGMLLAMFIADAEGRRITAHDLFAQVEASSAQGQRWLRVLMDMGLTASEGPCTGQNIVSLTAQGISAIEACMMDAQQLMGSK